MEIELRLEKKEDEFEVENLTREAFWDVYKPGCDEHFVLHQLRKTDAFIPALSVVALSEGKILGHIAYSKAHIKRDGMPSVEVLTFGPLSVLPAYQAKGIGGKLVNHTIELARKMGYKGIFIFGNPDYYHHFGFVNAEKFHVTTSDGMNFDPFMGLELYEGALTNVSGKLFINEVFFPVAEDASIYDEAFPPREKHITPTQFVHP